MRDFWNNFGNIFMKPLLRSPLHFLVSGQFLLISITGRKTGKTYITPVQYRRDGDILTVFTQRHRKWWKNLQGGAPVSLRLRGREVTGEAQVATHDLGDIQKTLHWMYPHMPQAQIEMLVPISVLIRIHLREAAA